MANPRSRDPNTTSRPDDPLLTLDDLPSFVRFPVVSMTHFAGFGEAASGRLG